MTRQDLRDAAEQGRKRYGTLENVIRKCPECGKELVVDTGHSGPWGTFYLCPTHGSISSQNIVYENGPGRKIGVKNDNGPSDADVHAKAQEMFKDSWDNLSSKQQDQVYEALDKEMKNDAQDDKRGKPASQKEKCSRCGASIQAGSGTYHGYDYYCDDCSKKKGYNNTLPTRVALANATQEGRKRYGSIENSGYDPKWSMSYVKCKTCGTKTRSVDSTTGQCQQCYEQKPVENEVENDSQPKCTCGHYHDGDVCDDCECTIYHKATAKNADDGYNVGDKVDVHGETGTITKVKSNGNYSIRFHYGMVDDVADTDIEGIASHIPAENAGSDVKCKMCGENFQPKDLNEKGYCSICSKEWKGRK